MLNYSLHYRQVSVPTLDEQGHKQYDEHDVLITHQVVKAYAKAQAVGVMSLNDFAAACIVSGNVSWSRADIIAFISEVSGAIETILLSGQSVDLGDLGRFSPRVASSGCEADDEWIASRYIKKAYAGWTRPDALGDFKDECEFNLVEALRTKTELNKMMRSGATQTIISRSVSAAQAEASGQLSKHLLTLAISPTGGGVVNGGGNYGPGKVVNIFAAALPGYEFAGWYDGSELLSANASYAYTMADTAKTLTAHFSESGDYYTQTVSVGSGMESMGSVSGGGSFAEGTEITIHAVANSGYTFKGWKLNGGSGYESTEADYTFEVEADNSFVAEFEAEAAQVTLTVGQDTNPNWGNIQINDRTAAESDSITVASGTSVTVKAIAASGYQFSSWSDGNTNATRTITLTENKTLNASFESR